MLHDRTRRATGRDGATYTLCDCDQCRTQEQAQAAALCEQHGHELLNERENMALPEFTHGEWYCRACTHKGTPWQANGGPGWVWRGCAACRDIWPEQLPEQPADAEVKPATTALENAATLYATLCKARGCLADIIKNFPEVATP